MNSAKLYKYIIPLLVIATVLSISCAPVFAQRPQISKLVATQLYVYPQGKTEITCIATAPEGEKLSYSWTCSDGSLEINDATVTWTAPNKYGDFHIMVIAEDSKGNSDQATISIGVVVNEHPFVCPSCPR